MLHVHSEQQVHFSQSSTLPSLSKSRHLHLSRHERFFAVCARRCMLDCERTNSGFRLRCGDFGSIGLDAPGKKLSCLPSSGSPATADGSGLSGFLFFLLLLRLGSLRPPFFLGVGETEMLVAVMRVESPTTEGVSCDHRPSDSETLALMLSVSSLPAALSEARRFSRSLMAGFSREPI